MNSQVENAKPVERAKLVASDSIQEQTAPAMGRVKYWKVSNHGSLSVSRGVRRGRPPGPPCSRLIEWHTLAPLERDAAWRELLLWVTWLHDRYELSVESRLPRCWSQHPGLIDELWALKVWREEIYNGKESSGQAARYWHAELRQTIHAATTFYAAGCRSGHKSVAIAADANPELLDRWAAGNPVAGVSATLLLASQAAVTSAASTDGKAGFIPDEVMRGHIGAGRASFISKTMRDAINYDDSWWYMDPARPGGWRRNTDSDFAELCDRRAVRLAAADAAVDQRNALRRMLGPDEPSQGAGPRPTRAGD